MPRDDDVLDAGPLTTADPAATLEGAPAVKLVSLVLRSAIAQGASDIHLEPYEQEYRIRFRIDGVLHRVMSPPVALRDAMVSRLKILAGLDIAERRLPQDGRLKLQHVDAAGARRVDIRISTLPTLFGEKIVMRLLDESSLMLDMTALGFDDVSLARFRAAIERPWGLVLVTGPTGSGKTSTLYSAIARLNTIGTNIVTAEDPVEFNLPGVNQVQVREGIGLTFAAALRSFLRQDPNIILVGEIRDYETAEIAVKAALTGHLVLSTLHTNDAPSAVSRLMNMGIEPFLLASSVTLVCAQRLVRRVCVDCRVRDDAPPDVLARVGFDAGEGLEIRAWKGAGCDRCHGTGYRGRVGLFEVMTVTDALRDLIQTGASALELRQLAIEEGMATLVESGRRKVRETITSIDEVLRETAG